MTFRNSKIRRIFDIEDNSNKIMEKYFKKQTKKIKSKNKIKQ